MKRKGKEKRRDGIDEEHREGVRKPVRRMKIKMGKKELSVHPNASCGAGTNQPPKATTQGPLIHILISALFRFTCPSRTFEFALDTRLVLMIIRDVERPRTGRKDVIGCVDQLVLDGLLVLNGLISDCVLQHLDHTACTTMVHYKDGELCCRTVKDS